jgi:2-dehydropantoate 2-reductase
MTILIYGAGVQGSLYGARLCEAGHDVSLLAQAPGLPTCGLKA